MKKIILLFLISSIFSSFYAQNCNAVFFNQEGKRFHLILNGILQNQNYETNVKVTDLSYEGNYKVTIDFEDQQLPNIDKNIYMMEQSSEYTYNIKQNKKGQYVLRAMSVVPIAQAPASATTQSVIVYSTTPPAPSTTSVTETVSTTTTTNVGNGNNQENVSMGVNMNNMGMNVNVNINDGMNTSTTTSYSETVTTTTSTSSTYSEAPTTNQYVMEGYSGPVGCSYPMNQTDFNSAKQSIASKSFSDSKLTIAKQVTKANCITADQAKQIIKLFDFEETRLEYAKFAYDYTYDKGNYYKVNDAFDFESSIEELNNYIENR